MVFQNYALYPHLSVQANIGFALENQKVAKAERDRRIRHAAGILGLGDLRVQMRSEVLRVHRSIGAATLYVTHDQTEAMTMGDRVAVLQSGVLQQYDTPRALYDRPANVFVATFIGSPAMNLYEAGLSADGPRSRPTVVLGSEKHVDFWLDATPAAQASAGADEPAEAGFLAGSAPNGMARIDPHTPVAPGGRVTFTVDPARLYFFDPDTGQAITG
jgi:ABC-type sugar transport system ATPase subunit